MATLNTVNREFVISQLYFDFSMTSLISTAGCIRIALSRQSVQKAPGSNLALIAGYPKSGFRVLIPLISRIIQRYGPLIRPSK
jgi:hypothetical protein